MAGLLTRGNEKVPGGNENKTPYWRPAVVGKNTAFVLHPSLDSVFGARKMQAFKKGGAPVDATWAMIPNEPKEVGLELGLKSDAKMFVWVAVLEDNTWVRKLYECREVLFENIANAVNEYGLDLQGLKIVVEKNKQGRWEVGAFPPKNQALPQATLDTLWAEIVAEKLDGSEENDAVYRMIGMFPSVQAEKEFIMRRMELTNWNAVRKAFGLEPEKGTVADEDLEELE